LLLLLVRRITLIKLALRFDHGFQGLFISTKFIDFDLGALIVEVGQAFERLGLAVELYDSLHDIWIVVPVLVTQEVACHDPHFGGTGRLRKADDSPHVTRLK